MEFLDLTLMCILKGSELSSDWRGYCASILWAYYGTKCSYLQDRIGLIFDSFLEGIGDFPASMWITGGNHRDAIFLNSGCQPVISLNPVICTGNGSTRISIPCDAYT